MDGEEFKCLVGILKQKVGELEMISIAVYIVLTAALFVAKL